MQDACITIKKKAQPNGPVPSKERIEVWGLAVGGLGACGAEAAALGSWIVAI